MSTDSATLDDWLEIATRGLSEASKARVAAEIREHYRDATASGLTPGVALDQLGDPDAARRSFRRAFLTRSDEELVKGYRGRPPGWRLAIYGGLFALTVGVAIWGPESAAQRIAAGVIVATSTTAFLGLAFGVGRLYQRGHERMAIFLGAICDFLMYVGLIVGGSFVLGDASIERNAFFGAILVLLLVLYVPLLRKLRNDPDGVA